MQDDLSFYARHSAHTDPGDFAHLLDGAPADWADLRALPPKVILHYFFADDIDPPLSEERQRDRRARPLAKILARMAAVDPRPLTEERASQQRFSGNCRDFALLTCGLLRQAGVPARLRCGFATYFTPGRYEDHWVCEAWDKAEQRWRLIDAQLDPGQCARFAIAFDPGDVPRDAFLTAGEAWRLLQVEPGLGDRFGISFVGIAGGWFAAGNLLRDLAALNKVEVQVWDWWSFATGISDAMAIPMEKTLILNEITETISGENPDLGGIRALYGRADLAVPERVVAYPDGAREICPVY